MPLRRRPAAHRGSDLLAFEIAIERSHPGSVMTGYNKVNGDYAGGNAPLINDVLKDTWGYRGRVMSDWGATPDWEFALCGLDQESGVQLDAIVCRAEPFAGPLRQPDRHVRRLGQPCRGACSYRTG
jgi:beta-glucosidase